MKYCVEHNKKAYTEKQFDRVKVCDHSGCYMGAGDGKIRVYCFKALDKVRCPHDTRKK